MFFFIGGIQPKTVLIDKNPRYCPACGHLKVHLKRVDQYVSLFFIPLFPIKKGNPLLICENCHSKLDERGYEMGAEQKKWERRCSHCGRSIEPEPDFSYCPYCGKSI